MNEIIFPHALQSLSELNALTALIKDVCAQENVFVCRADVISPYIFVIHGGWLQSRPCQDGVSYRAISAKKLANHFYSHWLPLHQACVAGDEDAYLAARANLLQAALNDRESHGRKAAFWGGLTSIDWSKTHFSHLSEESQDEKAGLLLGLAYQFGVSVFWACHTTLALKGQKYMKGGHGSTLPPASTIQTAALLLHAQDERGIRAWVESMLRGDSDFHELPLAFRKYILTRTAHDFLTVLQQQKGQEGNHA